MQSSSPSLPGGAEELLANSEFSEETELWTRAVEDERRYIEGDLVATEGSVGRRGREGKAEVIGPVTGGGLERSGCGAVWVMMQAGEKVSLF